MIVVGVLTLITVIIMLVQGNFQGFINYTILGMKEFTGNNLNIGEQVEFVILAYGIIVIASYILTFFLLKSKEIQDRNIIILAIFAIFLNLSAYPIFNLYHTSFAILLNLMIFIYIFEKLLLKRIVRTKIKVVLLITVYIVINIFCINCGLQKEKNIKITDKSSVYYFANMNEELNKNLEIISEYIIQKEKEGIDVICISADSALYMTALSKNHQELDLIFEGNLGYNGKEKTIEKIKNLDNVEILMNKSSYWQELTELRNYITINYERITTVGDCYVFKNNIYNEIN